MDNAEEYYSSIMDHMREEGGKDNPETLLLGTMLGRKTVEIDGLKLSSSDYLISASCKGDLKKGDLVAIMKCENMDTYVILCKVVSA